MVAASKGRGTVEFFDGGTLAGVDVSVAGAARGSYVEVFGDLALSVLTAAEARVRRREWNAVRRAASAPVAGARPR